MAKDAAAGSPYHQHYDEEAADGGVDKERDHFEEEDSPFRILRTKNAPIDRLKRWRQAALVLNSSRRFRYTLDLKKEEESEEMRRKIRTHAQVIQQAIRFREASLATEQQAIRFREASLATEQQAIRFIEASLATEQAIPFREVGERVNEDYSSDLCDYSSDSCDCFGRNF